MFLLGSSPSPPRQCRQLLLVNPTTCVWGHNSKVCGAPPQKPRQNVGTKLSAFECIPQERHNKPYRPAPKKYGKMKSSVSKLFFLQIFFLPSPEVERSRHAHKKGTETFQSVCTNKPFVRKNEAYCMLVWPTPHNCHLKKKKLLRSALLYYIANITATKETRRKHPSPVLYSEYSQQPDSSDSWNFGGKTFTPESAHIGKTKPAKRYYSYTRTLSDVNKIV